MVTFEVPQNRMQELGVAGVFLFGSQASGTAREDSDYDFAVLLKDTKTLADSTRRNHVYNALYDLFAEQINALCNIDIVFIQSADLQLRFHVARDGRLLYLGDPSIVGDFLEQTMTSYADFEPLRREFHQAILERI